MTAAASAAAPASLNDKLFLLPDEGFDFQAIVTDMDGTFFASGCTVLPSTLKALKRCVQLNIPVIPATGRTKNGLQNALKALDSTVPAGTAGTTGSDVMVGSAGPAGTAGSDVMVGLAGPAGTAGSYSMLGSAGLAGTAGSDGMVGSAGSAGTAASTADLHLYPGVYLNGAAVFGSDGEILHKETLEWDVVNKCVEFARKLNQQWMEGKDKKNDENDGSRKPVDFGECTAENKEHGFSAVLDKSLKASLVTIATYSDDLVGPRFEELTQLADGIKQFNEGEFKIVGDLREYTKDHPAYKLMLIAHSGETWKQFRGELESMIGDKVEMHCGIPRILEVVSKGTNKAVGLLAVAKHLGLIPQSLVCLGDGENDADMVACCGFSVAMGNASAVIQQLANSLTLSNDDGGWAVAVNALLNYKLRQSKGPSTGAIPATAATGPTAVEPKATALSAAVPAAVPIAPAVLAKRKGSLTCGLDKCEAENEIRAEIVPINI